jgi:cobalt-zinc-cadmium efflux system outer membrane protein
MWAERKLVCVVAVVLFALLAAGCLEAAAYLRPEWEVGQSQVSAQDLQVIVPPTSPEKLSLDESIQLALRQNLGFRRTVQTLLAARSNWYVVQQRWSLEAFGSVQRTHATGGSAGDGTSTNDSTAGAAFAYSAVTGADFSVTAELDRLATDEDQRSVTATFRQPLLAGSGRASAAYEEVREARNRYRAALLSFFVDRQDLIEQVISGYFGTVEQQQLVDIQDASVKLAEQAVRDAEVRLKEQVISEIDVTRAQLRLSREQTAAVGQRQALQDSMDQLLLLLGLQVGAMPDLVTAVNYAPEPLDLAALQAQALESRPDLRLADLSIEDRQAVLRIARSSRLPTLDLFAAWSRQRDGIDERSWDVGLDLSVPVASRFLREAVYQASWGLLVSEQMKENLKQQVIADVRSQVRAAEAARANVDIAAQGVEVANKSMYIAHRMVEEGLATNRDVLDAQDEIRRSESQLVSSKINYYLALARLKVAVGQDVMPKPAPEVSRPSPESMGRPAPSELAPPAVGNPQPETGSPAPAPTKPEASPAPVTPSAAEGSEVEGAKAGT